MANASPDNAYEHWREGAKQFPINNQKEFNTAIRHFKQAIRLDASFARSHGWLGYSYAISVVDGWKLPKPDHSLKPAQILDKALQLAEKAVELDPGDYDTFWARGYVRLHRKEAAKAQSDFETARRLNVSNRDLLVENADERVYAGDPDKAVELIMRALRVPDWYRWTLGWAYYFKARTDPVYYDLAIRELEQICEQPGEGKCPAEVLVIMAAIYAQKAHIAQDQAEKKRLQKLAEDKRKAFRKLRETGTLRHFEQTNPFKRAEDRKHLIEGLKRAKFPR